MDANLVTRLRGWLDEDTPIGVIMAEAAARIEELEAALNNISMYTYPRVPGEYSDECAHERLIGKRIGLDLGCHDCMAAYARSRAGGRAMSLWPSETDKRLNEQHDVYAAAREEYRKKISEQAARIEALAAALREIAAYEPDEGCPCSACHHSALARAALEEKA